MQGLVVVSAAERHFMQLESSASRSGLEVRPIAAALDPPHPTRADSLQLLPNCGPGIRTLRPPTLPLHVDSPDQRSRPRSSRFFPRPASPRRQPLGLARESHRITFASCSPYSTAPLLAKETSKTHSPRHFPPSRSDGPDLAACWAVHREAKSRGETHDQHSQVRATRFP